VDGIIVNVDIYAGVISNEKSGMMMLTFLVSLIGWERAKYKGKEQCASVGCGG
jgi:hypothetical protein